MSDQEAARRGLKPLGIFRGFAAAGCSPDEMGIGPVFAVPKLLKRAGLTVEDIDLAIFTQVNKTTIERVAGSLGLPMEKAHLTMQKVGYTGSACIPIALHDAVEAGRVRAGDLVVLVGSGVGYNQAAIAFRAGEAMLRPA